MRTCQIRTTAKKLTRLAPFPFNQNIERASDQAFIMGFLLRISHEVFEKHIATP